MRGSLVGFLSSFAAGIAFIAFFCAMLLVFRFYAIGTTSADTATGHTFPIPAHGTLYVQPEQGHLFYGLLVAFVVFAIVSFLLRRKHSKSDEPHK